MPWWFTWSGHHWVMLYVIAVVAMLYWPPKAFNGMGTFITTHFGDSIGLVLLYTGIGLLIMSGFYSQLQQVGQVAQSLIMTAIGVLKLTKPTAETPPPTGLEVAKVGPKP